MRNGTYGSMQPSDNQVAKTNIKSNPAMMYYISETWPIRVQNRQSCGTYIATRRASLQSPTRQLL